jgi:hypothetical protein
MKGGAILLLRFFAAAFLLAHNGAFGFVGGEASSGTYAATVTGPAITRGQLDRAVATDGDARRSPQESQERRRQQAEEATVYRVGVLAIRGFDAAYAEFNATFSDYLTETAGARLGGGGGGVRFELKPLNFNLLFTDVADRFVGELRVCVCVCVCVCVAG